MNLEKSVGPEDAIDLSHHLSALARNRNLSPLKELYKYIGRPGMIPLAGGMPSPEYFPFEAIRADTLVKDKYPVDNSAESQHALSWFWNLLSSSQSTDMISIPKYADKPNDIDLATSLQYSTIRGLPQISAICMEISNRIYKPAYANFTTLVHAGNTDGWAKSVMTLCNPGDGVLCDEWTYPTALSAMQPYRISAIPVQMDVHGMRSDALRELLASWDPVLRGMVRPHVMYIVPVGQNPTGSTMKSARKKEIYQICVEYDIIIVEDDPYYFLQEGGYKPPSQRNFEVAEINDEQYIASLVPTFLRFDYQGRVIRLDSFSKTIAPGCRLGWYTCNPLFAERIERAAEISTQAPSGFTQSLVTALMQKWQFTGYIRWLKGLSAQYTQRRDFFLDLLVKKFDIEIKGFSEKSDSPVYHAYLSESQFKSPVFSFVPPSAGMFLWLKFTFDNHPAVRELGSKTLEEKLWVALAEAGVLVAPGNMFAADSSVLSSGNTGHFRISFSYAENEALRKAVDILADVIRDFYRDQKA